MYVSLSLNLNIPNVFYRSSNGWNKSLCMCACVRTFVGGCLWGGFTVSSLCRHEWCDDWWIMNQEWFRSKSSVLIQILSRDSSLSIVPGYGLENRQVGTRVPVRARLLSSPSHPDQFWKPPRLLSSGSFSGGKWAGAWSWPLTSICCRDQGYMDLYSHSHVSLHGIVLD
jgi:hypothetical protein